MPNNISDLLTPLSLAIWVSERGVYYKSGLIIRISTNARSFTKEEVLLLLVALESKFSIQSRLEKYNGNLVLYIIPKSIPLLKILLEPYDIPTLRYSLGLLGYILNSRENFFSLSLWE